MSERPVPLATPPLSPATDHNGLIVSQHITNGGRWEVPGTAHHGEFLLCGKGLDYSTFTGFAPGRTVCPVCESRDG